MTERQPDPDPPTPGDQQRREMMSFEAQYHGPLPPPQMLQQYERVFPGMAERIVRRFERQAEHRQTMERTIVEAQIAQERAAARVAGHGQVFGAIVAVTGLLVAGFVGIFGQTTAHAYAAATIGGVTLATMVGMFVVGRLTEPDHPQPDESRDE